MLCTVVTLSLQCTVLVDLTRITLTLDLLECTLWLAAMHAHMFRARPYVTDVTESILSTLCLTIHAYVSVFLQGPGRYKGA